MPAIAIYQAPEFCLNCTNAGNNCLSIAWRTAGKIVALPVYICSTMPFSALARASLKPRTAHSHACSAVEPLETSKPSERS